MACNRICCWDIVVEGRGVLETLDLSIRVGIWVGLVDGCCNEFFR